MAEEQKFDDEGPISLESEAEEAPEPSSAANKDEEEERWTLVEPSEVASDASSFTALGSAQKADYEEQFDRSPNKTGEGAVRCRVFHSKIQETGLEFMQDQINQWLDAHPEIEVKQVGHMVGEFSGKSSHEPNVIVMVWY
jgi:hypothetical protein